MENKLVVGQKVLHVVKHFGVNATVSEEIVASVGRKFFTLEANHNVKLYANKYRISDLRNEFYPQVSVYLDPQIYYDECEQKELAVFCAKVNYHKLLIAQLKEIKTIVEQNK